VDLPPTCRTDGDRERTLVVGGRFGKGSNGVPLKFQWHKNGAPIGSEGRIPLNSGDLYFMSEKAVGFDCLDYSILTLKHAAGKDTFKASVGKRKAGEDAPSVMML